MQGVRRKVGFDRKAFAQELLVEVFPRWLTHEHAATLLVFKWSTGTAQHLENIHHRIVDVAMLPAFVELNAHDNDHIASYW